MHKLQSVNATKLINVNRQTHPKQRVTLHHIHKKPPETNHHTLVLKCFPPRRTTYTHTHIYTQCRDESAFVRTKSETLARSSL